MKENINLSRRRLFSRRKDNALRPPFVRDDIEFTDLCSRCGDCMAVCETKIIVKGEAGFPEVRFDNAECTFCGECAKVCPEPIFALDKSPAWTLKASINDTCLAHRGIWCQSCKDACDASAIRFTPTLGHAPTPELLLDACTGCGACVAPCPADAIVIIKPETSPQQG